jgi:hypothetical protein
MTVIAAIIEKEGQRPHVILKTFRSGLHVAVQTYCSKQLSANSTGVLQLPDNAKCCEACEAAVKTMVSRLG